VGSPGDTAAVTAALDGVDAVFLVLVGDVETEVRGFTAALSAAAAPPRVVLLSSSSVVHPVPHRIAEEHRAAETAVAAATARWTFLRPGPFHSNALWWTGSVRGTGTVRCLVGNRPGAPIDPDDVAAVAVRALTEDGHDGLAYELTGPQTLTSGDQVRILARAAGRPIRFEVAAAEQAVAVFTAAGSDPVAAEGNVAALRSREVPWGRPNGTAERLLGRPPRPFHAWAAEHAAAFG